MGANLGHSIHGMGITRVVAILKKIPIFHGMFDTEYLGLIEVCKVVQMDAGKVLFSEGQSGNEVFVLLAGEVEISTKKAGKICTVEPGEIIGEIAVVCQISRSATAMVSADSSFLCLSRSDIDMLVGRAPRTCYVIMHNIAQTLAKRLMDANKRIAGENGI